MNDAATWISGIMSLGTLAVVFRAGQTIAKLEHSQESLDKRLSKLDALSERFETVGVLQTQVGMLQSTVARLSSEWPKVGARLQSIEDRMPAEYRPRMSSRHEDDT